MIRYEIYNDYNSEDYLNLLKRFPIGTSKTDNNDIIQFTYADFNSIDAIEFRETLKVPNQLGVLKNIKSIISLMNWFKNKFDYSPRSPDINQLGYLFDGLDYRTMLEKLESGEYPFLPKYQSLFFTYVLLSLGYKARWVACLPIDTQHLFTMYVAEIFLEEKNKWITVDICNNCLYCDKNGTPLNLIEMRNFIVKEKCLITYNLKCEINNELYKIWVRCLFKFKYVLANTLDIFKKKWLDYLILVPEQMSGTKKSVFDYSNNTYISYEFCFYSSLVY